MSQRPSERIIEEVTSWPGVITGPGPRGEFSFTVDGADIGHLHGDRSAHVAFPGHVSERRIASGAGIEEVIALMRINYDRVVARHGRSTRQAA